MDVSLKKGQLVSVRLPFRSNASSSGYRGSPYVWEWVVAEVWEVRDRSTLLRIVDPATFSRTQVVEVAFSEEYLRFPVEIVLIPD